MALVETSTFDSDVSFAKGNTTAVGLDILSCLESKGFCVVDPGIPAADLKDALSELLEGGKTSFDRPPELVVDGLLGSEGSARIMDMGIPDSENAELPASLVKVDAAITEAAAIINQFVDVLGFTCPTRTAGLVHETSMPAAEAPEMGMEEASTWLSTFIRQKLMLIVCLGPIAGTMELQPFAEDLELYEVPTQPGSMIILRADAMTHRHYAHSKAFLMSCFLLESEPTGKTMQAMQDLAMVPVAKEIHDWTLGEMKKLKEHEYEYNQLSEAPDTWLTAMNHLFCIHQRIAVRGVSGKLPSTHKSSEWFLCQTQGTDLVTEVPQMRWRVEDTYDPEPECWRWQKIFLKHGSFMDGAELFEPRFFGLSPQEAKGMDPNQRLVLETGYEACWAAGYKKGKMMNSLGGMYLGSGATIFGMVAEVSGATGGAASINSNRFSFCLGMKGPSMTVDTEGSSGLAAIYLGCEGTLDKGRGTVNAYSVAGGVHIQLGTIWYPQLQAAGLLTRQGRTKTFDESGDGYCVSDGCIMSCLKRLTENVQNEQVFIRDEPLVGSIAGCSMNSNGMCSKMSAPSGPAQLELVAEALRVASLAGVNIDAVDCQGQGAVMNDAIEVDSLTRILRGGTFEQPLGLMGTKSIMGHADQCAGTATFLKALLANEWGTICPNLHLKQINPYTEAEAKVLYNTDVVEYPMTASYTGAMSTGFGGTNVFAILHGEIDRARLTEVPEELKREYITFWPGGGGALEDSQMPKRGYYICGSWSGWIPEVMQKEDMGSYGYTVTLGENRWEDFKILLDGDKARCLHPEMPKAFKGTVVQGPDSGVRSLNWRITGSEGYVDESALAISDEALGGTAPDLKHVTMGDTPMTQAGDQYRVHFKVLGKFQSITWEKIGHVEADTVPVSEYFVTSSWNGWTLDKMTKDGNSYSFEVQLLREGGEFQIVRNQDWGQVIFSGTPFQDQAGTVSGPEDITLARGLTWYLGGKAGDYFKIKLEREADNMDVSWEKTKQEKLTEEQEFAASQPIVGVVGSWSGFLRQTYLTVGSQGQNPRGGAKRATLHYFVEIGPEGSESFQLLNNGDWENVVHPHVTTEGSGTQHWILSSPLSPYTWIIGKADNAVPGDVFKVTVIYSFSKFGGRVVQVSWAKAQSGEDLSATFSKGSVLRSE